MRWTYEFKVGLFAISAILVIIYMFFILSPDMFRNRSELTYYTLVDDASGIVVKTQVKTNGVVIGKVKNVQLYGNQSRIDFSVQTDVKVPRGSEVIIKEKGLLGDVFLEVLRAEDKGDYLKNGEFLEPSRDQVSISKLVSVANSIGKDIKKITATFSDVIGGDDGKKNLSSIITDVRDIASTLKGILGENRAELKSVISNLNKTTTNLDSIISGRKKDLGEIVTNIKDLTAGLRDVLSPDNRDKLNRIIASLDSTMSDAQGIAKKINDGQGSLGRLVNDDKMINEIQEAVKDIRGVLAPAKKMQVSIDYHAEYYGNSRTQGYLNVLLQPRPDKFYLLGITDVVENEKDVFWEKLPANPGQADPDATTANRYHKTWVERNNIRFNIQYAQRWNFAQLRFGLFQTTGGLAGDFFLLDDHLKVSFEAFDFRKSDKRNFARLKTYASILFFNHLYAMVGADDLTRRDPYTGVKKDPLYFFGGGFYFTDDDLKGLFGLASAKL